jgi:hypothetical protein
MWARSSGSSSEDISANRFPFAGQSVRQSISTHRFALFLSPPVVSTQRLVARHADDRQVQPKIALRRSRLSGGHKAFEL